ncbi:MAG: sugar ABC transporter permease [Ktedonobacteraceae bacterium]
MSDTIEKDESSGSSTSAVATSVEVPTTAAVPQKRTARELLRGDLGFIPVLVTLIVIMAFFTIASGGIFLKPENLSNLVLQIATIGIIGLGEILVLLLGEIDLSVAAVSVFCAVVMAVLSERAGVPGVVAILVALLAGALVGFINGFFIAYLRVPSFIVTLAASIFYSGLLLNLLAGQSTLIIRDPIIVGIAGTPVSFLPDLFGIGLPILGVLLYALSVSLNFMRRRRAGLRTVSMTQLILQIVLAFVIVLGVVTLFQSYQGVPYATAILVALIVLFWIILTKTPFGRHVYAVGGNNEAARRAGINVVGIRIAVFTLCSTLAAVGGIVQASRGLAVASQIDPVLLLNAIAAAVIGGVSLFGGRGSVWAIVLGGLIIGSLVNGLALLNQGTDVAEMVEGVVLLLAVTIDAVARRLQARSGR